MKPYGHGHTRMHYGNGRKWEHRLDPIRWSLREKRRKAKDSRRMGRLVGRAQVLDYLNERVD